MKSSGVRTRWTGIPEPPAENWPLARRGDLYRPLKQSVTIRLDADVLNRFKEHAAKGHCQTEINRILRRHVTDAERRRAQLWFRAWRACRDYRR